ncbi:hypothetical protein Pint_09483 [Pistacia integerrima]|uniref:Uncharacterized protein n=1 Tax=Pistacia integerrima TaxID=434235 RepID=A0ACC0XHZ3_9ROSI|nr:hypothetical protein Pint_09483 [Pistacia integerrima]
MLKTPKLTSLVSKTLLKSLFKVPCFAVYSSGFISDSTIFRSNDSESDNEWERLLKPFDINELRKSLNKITPYQLCKLLALPLDVDTCMQLFSWAGAQKGYCHSFDVYYVLIDKLGGNQEFRVIDGLLLQMKEEGIVFRETLFILILKHYGKAGFPGQATRLLLDMKSVYGCEPSFKSYNVVLEILVAGNCHNVAPNVFYDMLSKGASPTVYTFGVVMKALCMVNEVDSACKLLRDMTKHGCVPNSVVYQTLIHALGAIQEALKLANDMLFRGCPLDEITYNGLIKALCKAGAVDKGLALFEEMMRKEVIPSNISCNILINGLCRTGKVNTALEFLRDMIHRVGTSHMLRIGDSKGTFRKWLLSLTLLLSLLSSGGVALPVKFYKPGRQLSVQSHVLVMVAVYPICKVKISKGDVRIIGKCIIAASTRTS